MTAIPTKEQGDNLYKQSKFREAILCYNTIVEGQTNNQQDITDLHIIYSNRCACYLQINDVVKAIEDANSCIRLKPNWFKGYSRKAACLLKLNLAQEAALAYDKVIELDPNNNEAINALNRIRSNNSNPYSTRNETFTSILNGLWDKIKYFISSIYNKIMNFDLNSLLQSIQRFFAMLYSKLMTWWFSLNETTTSYIKLGLVVSVLYYYFFYRNSSSSYSSYPMDDPDFYHHNQGSHNSYDNNGYNNYYGSNSYGTTGGMSWTTWGLIMLSAWKLPPLFPEQLGEYAKPFFGMSWTTFMWLLNMFSRNTAGMSGGGGGYNRGGGFFGNRRRW